MPDTATMEAIVSLCKRRGFIFPASEIYGGLNGFWDYGPLGTALKNNVRDAWWHDMVECPPMVPMGSPSRSSALIRPSSRILECGKHPVTWAASTTPWWTAVNPKPGTADHLGFLGRKGDSTGQIFAFVSGDDASLGKARKKLEKYVKAELSDEELDVCGIESITC